MGPLVVFTVDHFVTGPDFVRLTDSENLNRGKYVATSKAIPEMSSPRKLAAGPLNYVPSVKVDAIFALK